MITYLLYEKDPCRHSHAYRDSHDLSTKKIFQFRRFDEVNLHTREK